MIIAPGTASVSVDVFFADDTGAALTGKVASDFPVCKWSAGDNTADTTITLSDLALITTAHPNNNTAGGVKEREGGWYRLDLPNNVLTAAGRKTLTFAETTNKRIIAPQIDVQYVQGDVQTIKTQAVTCAAAVTVLASVGTAATNTAQTGDNFARIGVAGAGLTALGDTRIANLDAAVSSRMATYAQPTGFLATTFAGTVGTSTYAGGDTSGVATLLTRVTAAVMLASNYAAPPSAVSIRQEIDSNSVGLAAIYTDTHTTLPAAIDAVPTNAELATALAAADDAVLAAIAALNNLSAAQVNAEADAALADVGLTVTVTGRIDAAISTRTKPADTQARVTLVDTVTTNTDMRGTDGANTTTPPTAAQNADALIGRNIAGGSSTGRTVGQALAASRNKVAFDVPTAGSFTVYATDDVTPLWVGTYARGANTLGPLTSTDPTG